MRKIYKIIIRMRKKLKERQLHSLLQKIGDKIRKLQENPGIEGVSEV